MAENPNADALDRRPARAVYLLPNLFTTGGLFGGFYAIIAAGQGKFCLLYTSPSPRD